jgi:hypothetical protein
MLNEAKNPIISNLLGECVLSSTGGAVCKADRISYTSSLGDRQGLILDITQLPAGLYFVRIGDIIMKFIKI